MKRLLFMVACALVAFATSAAATGTTSKQVGYPPPKAWRPPTTTVQPPPTINPTTTSTTTTTSSTTTTTTTTVTTTAPTTTLPAVNPPAHVFYGMRPDHNIQIEWDYDGPTACFFADSVSLCDRTTRTGNHFAAVVIPALFGGTLPLCVIMSTHIGPATASAPPQCQGARAI